MPKHYFIQCPSLLSFKVYGQGPCIVLLHPSPNSSRIMHALAEKLASNFTVLCPDTPGYGDSVKLDKSDPSMTDYAALFKSWLDHMGVSRCSVYGSATGAQIAIRLGIEYPEMVEHLYLDNSAHFTDEERVSILEHYFPDLTPQLDGSHLPKIWDIVSSLFAYFPWCFKEEKYKLNGPLPPPSILNSIAIDYLIAGKDYDLAYKAAFRHEKVDYIKQLTVPTSILRWESSIIKKYTDRIFDHTLPSNIRGYVVPADPAERYQHMVNHIEDQKSSKASCSIDLSQAIEQQAQSTKKHVDPPALDKNGSHLQSAWMQLKQELQETNEINSVDLSSMIQKRLIQWYM